MVTSTTNFESRQPSRCQGFSAGPELTVVIPTKNERDNVPQVYERLLGALKGLDWEVIFVDDDSGDGTSRIVCELARDDRRVRLIQRLDRRGLSSACIEGALGSTSAYIAFMDADLQHDETLLPKMFDAIQDEAVDIVVASRYVAGGSISLWSHRRAYLSRFATYLGRTLLGISILDPMSGFFIVRRDAFQAAVRNMSAVGFKILIDLFASSPQPLRAKELPYTFRPRRAGETKLDYSVALEYLTLLIDKLVGHIVPIRFILFIIVGTTGIGTHLIILWAMLFIFQLPFVVSQSISTVTAMIGNFALNNLITYRDRRLSGFAFVTGLASFVIICGVGAIANVGVASLLYGEHHSNWFISGLAGAAMSSVWNYSVTSVLTWRRLSRTQ